jgi:hypothetical protein
MGFLKKITRPISKVLDKIVPNEIKPALPFLAAAAPFLAPGIMGTSMLQRALVSGGLNLGSQLAQEGSEGDFSPLSVALASGIGALSAPGTPGTGVGPAGQYGTTGGTPSAADFFRDKAAGMDAGFTKSGLGALESSSNYLTGVGETLRTNPFSMDGLKASLVPVGQATTDLAIAENRRLLKEQEQADADAAAEQGADNASRAFAIRQSMEAYGFTEQEILDAIEAAGYRAGGRVGFSEGGSDFGGITEAVEKIEKEPKKFLVDKLKVTMKPGQSEMRAIIEAMYNDVDGVMPDDRKKEFYELYAPQMYRNGEMEKSEFEFIQTEILGKEVPKMKEGGRVGLREGGGLLQQLIGQPTQITTIAQRPSLGSFQPLQQAQAVFPRLNQLEQGVDRAEGSLNKINQRLGDNQRQLPGLMGIQPFSLQPLNMGRLPLQLQEARLDASQGMKEGGLMNLGGKEMDLRKGGFVPIGKKERADDVPARLSKNEFVMTADAVRAAGGGSVNKGAKRMYDVMNKLEARA